MIGNQKHKVGTDPKFTGPDEIPLLPKFLSDQNPDQASHYHLLLKEWWESVYENLNRIRDMVVNFQVADLKEESGSDLTSAKNELTKLSNDLVRSLNDEINEAIQNLEGTLTKSITDHISSSSNPHSVTANQLNISTVGKTGDYGDLSSIPSEFEPSAHSHAYNTLTDIPNLFAPSAHNHAISDITDLSTSLDGKASKVSLGNYATKVSLGNIVPSIATTSTDGLMSSGDKTKLDGIPSGGGGGGLIDVFDISVNSSGNQAYTVPNYAVGQRLYILKPGGTLNGSGAQMFLIPAGPASSYPTIAAGNFLSIWVNSGNGTIGWWNSSGSGSSYYSIMRFSA